MTTSVNEELWKIFSYYTLHGDSLHADQMKKRSFEKLLKDSLIAKRPSCVKLSKIERVHMKKLCKSYPEYPKYMVSLSKLDYIYKQHCTKISPHLEFDGFMKCLFMVSVELYASSPIVHNVDVAFEMLLQHNILPTDLTKRRDPQTNLIEKMTSDSDVKNIFSQYKPGLSQIFLYYVKLENEKRKQLRTQYIGHKDLHKIGNVEKQKHRSVQRNIKLSREIDRLECSLSHRAFFQFASDFKIATCLTSTIETSEIYLASTKGEKGTLTRKLLYPQFEKTLLHISLLAYRSFGSLVSNANKLRYLFLHIYRSVTDSWSIHIDKQFHNLIQSSAPMDCSKTFLTEFYNQWKKEGYRNYLDRKNTIENDSQKIFEKLSEIPDNDSIKETSDLIIKESSILCTTSANPAYINTKSIRAIESLPSSVSEVFQRVKGKTWEWDNLLTLESIKEFLQNRPELMLALETHIKSVENKTKSNDSIETNKPTKDSIETNKPTKDSIETKNTHQKSVPIKNGSTTRINSDGYKKSMEDLIYKLSTRVNN